MFRLVAPPMLPTTAPLIDAFFRADRPRTPLEAGARRTWTIRAAGRSHRRSPDAMFGAPHMAFADAYSVHAR